MRSLLRRAHAALFTPLGRFLGVATATNVADGIRAVALPLLAAAVTRDPALVAGLGVAQSLPFLLVGLPAGEFADVLDRRRLLVVTNAVEAVLFTAIAAAVLLEVGSIPVLYGAAFLLGSNEATRDTTMSAAVPSVVADVRLDRANGRLVGVAFVGNQLLGPAVGGVLFAAAMVAPFLLSAALAVAALLLVLRLPLLHRRSNAHAATMTDRHALRGAVRRIVEGTRFLTGHELLRTILGLAVVVTFTDAAWFSVLVLLVTDELSQPEWTYGAVLAVAAVGGAAGGWVADRVIGRVGPAVVLRGGLVVFAGAQLMLGLTSHLMPVAAALAVGNAMFGVWLAAAASQRHGLTPNSLLGRVTGAWHTAAYGSIPLGALAGAFVADAFGLRAPFLGGVPLLLVAAAVARPLTSTSLRAAWSGPPTGTGHAP